MRDATLFDALACKAIFSIVLMQLFNPNNTVIEGAILSGSGKSL